MGSIQKILLWVCASMMLSACGPQYETSYQLQQPISVAGQACASTCNQVQMQCFDACEAGSRECEFRARLQDDMDGWMYGGAGGFSGGGIGIGMNVPLGISRSDTCQATACRAHCMANYHACYQNCGGNVRKITQCIAHCPTAAASPAPVRQSN
jgi:hypothetical protein